MRLQLVKQRIESVLFYLRTGIWRQNLQDLPPTKAFTVKQLRVVLLAIKGFNKDNCVLHASALTFYSMLSLVPVLALAFGIAKGFGLANRLRQEIIDNFSNQREVMDYLLQFSEQMLLNTKGGVIAGVGLGVLLWSVLKLMTNIEEAFNAVWEVHQTRPIIRRLTDYLSVILLAPILMVVASSGTIFIASEISSFKEQWQLLSYVGDVLLFFIKFVPYLIDWFLFVLLYMVMPNTIVKFRSALIAGILAGTVYQITQAVYINFQINVSEYNAIYGSFAALPLFLVWLQLSWLIILLGAEMSFALQHVDQYEYEEEAVKSSPAFKRSICLLITQVLAKNFKEGKAPLSAREIAARFRLPARFVRARVGELTEVKILSETIGDQREEVRYQPAQDIRRLTMHYVSHQLDHLGDGYRSVAESPSFDKLRKGLEDFDQLLSSSEKNYVLSEL